MAMIVVQCNYPLCAWRPAGGWRNRLRGLAKQGGGDSHAHCGGGDMLSWSMAPMRPLRPLADGQ